MQSTKHRLPDDSIKAYTKPGLRVYDTLVMGILANHVWDCPPDRFVAHYRKHITSNHAEIGVGTGYCLDRCGFDSPNPRLVLMDLQPNCLEYSARRLARYQPQTIVYDALQPLHLGIERFDSIALGGVLHCLPGHMREKGRVFDALQPIAAPGATVFGYTLVTDVVGHRARRRCVHYCLNRLRVISNASDRVGNLLAELSRRFVGSHVERVGCMAFFSAILPPAAGATTTRSDAWSGVAR